MPVAVKALGFAGSPQPTVLRKPGAPDGATLADAASKPDFQSRLFQDCVGGGFGRDGKGHTEPFAIDRTVLNFVATLALADKVTAGGPE
jgi:hypothetical protein